MKYCMYLAIVVGLLVSSRGYAQEETIVAGLDIEVAYVEYQKADIDRIFQEHGFVEEAKLVKLRKEGKAKLKYCPRVRTQSGAEATVKSVEECMYPTEFKLTATIVGSEESAKTNRQVTVTGVEPGGFQTREAGVMLSILPEVSPEYNVINLTFTPEVVKLKKWQDVTSSVGVHGTSKEHKTTCSQPYFFSQQISTTVIVLDGESTMIGGGLTSPDSDAITYVFVRAKIIEIKIAK
jgi:Flp pilus assembly secretin CpaC